LAGVNVFARVEALGGVEACVLIIMFAGFDACVVRVDACVVRVVACVVHVDACVVRVVTCVVRVVARVVRVVARVARVDACVCVLMHVMCFTSGALESRVSRLWDVVSKSLRLSASHQVFGVKVFGFSCL